jgi:hypothetical protein
MLKQEKQYINMAIRVGGTWFVQKNMDDAGGFFAQFMLDRRFAGKFLAGAGIAFHSYSVNEEKISSDVKPSTAVTGYMEWRPVRMFALAGEIAAAVTGYKSKVPVFGFSVRFLTYRHAFSIIVANTQYMTADGMVANSPRGFPDLLFGFQIVREFNIKDYN